MVSMYVHTSVISHKCTYTRMYNCVRLLFKNIEESAYLSFTCFVCFTCIHLYLSLHRCYIYIHIIYLLDCDPFDYITHLIDSGIVL